MKAHAKLTALPNLILCMLRRRPQSGYALCKTIETMPIGAISASPGSIYPCLKNLEDAGLILSKVVGGSAKPRKEFRISAQGKRVLDKWFAEPFDATTVVRSPENLYIKLSFLDSDPDRMSSLLADLGKELVVRKDSLQSYKRASEGKMTRGGLLALELSIQITALLGKWSSRAADEVNNWEHANPPSDQEKRL